MKHTPGPWEVGSPTGLVNQLSIKPAIGVVYGAGDEIKANAALIAAAPDMAEALLMWDKWETMSIYDSEMAILATRAALAKAGARG